jgi:hypothetical protein
MRKSIYEIVQTIKQKLARNAEKRKQMEEVVYIGSIFNCSAYFNIADDGGFGQFSFSYDAEKDTFFIEGETCSREYAAEVLHALADHITTKMITDSEVWEAKKAKES